MSPGACCTGPGYASPLEASRSGPREKLIYITAVVPDGSRPDYLATVDVDPGSATYSTVIHRLPTAPGDELHHSGWNACSSCHNDASRRRRYLVLPALKSGRVYAVDVSQEREPKIHTVVEAADIAAGTGGLAYPHTAHCLADGNVMVSAMGGVEGEGRGNFFLLDSETFEVKGTWAQDTTPYGYDFWYQPRLNTMLSTEFGAPRAFMTGFDPTKAGTEYGSKVHVWDWKRRTLRQTIDLGADGAIPLEVRFAHNPDANWAFVGCALSSNVVRLVVGPDGAVKHDFVIRQPWLKVDGWALPSLPPLVTDILLSLDDKRLFFSNWLRGDVVSYDVSDPANPRLAGRVWLGGLIAGGADGSPPAAAASDPADLEALGLAGGAAPRRAVVKGVEVQGGPQMLQLSLDGKRLYVSTSLLSPWDSQFYPASSAKGAQLVLLDVAPDGGLALNKGFVVDFGAEPGGPALAHEARYPGGDCSSDIWV